MKKNRIDPQQEVFWFHKHENIQKSLKGDHTTDVVIVGGGMAGISAAQKFRSYGLQVALLEQYHCGGGASGKSSGFVTANAELGLDHFVKSYGAKKAKAIWDFVNEGVTLIDNNIKKHAISCDYQKEDVIIVANSSHGFSEIVKEYNSYQKLGYESSLFDQDTLASKINSESYYGGMRFSNNFGINVYDYIQKMKKILIEEGVSVFEETPVLSLEKDGVNTAHGFVKAKNIIVCADRFIPELNKLTQKIFQVQTFILVSTPLDEKIVDSVFPHERYMVWDTDLIYQYYRITGDNRFMIGGSTMWHSFSNKPTYSAQSVYRKLMRYVEKKFPQLPLTIEYMWPGLIGISKDLQPIIGHDKQYPHIYYVGAATGLAWAAALGNYAAEHIVQGRTDFDAQFSPDRHFPLPDCLQKIVGKKATFSFSNLLALKGIK